MLDGFELRCCGEPLAIPMAAQRLLCFLALRQRPLHRGFVAGSLWFGGSESDAQASLRSVLGAFDTTVRHLSCARLARICSSLRS